MALKPEILQTNCLLMTDHPMLCGELFRTVFITAGLGYPVFRNIAQALILKRFIPLSFRQLGTVKNFAF